MILPESEPRYRWYILALAALTNTLVVAMPSMAMPVLFKEISADLHLNLVQVGIIWGIAGVPGLITALLGGAAGDWFGPKKVLVACSLLVGVTGALRGLSMNFASLAVGMVLMGAFTPFISMNTIKACGTWFSRQQLGLASGVISMGMALGFLTGAMFSATVFSPLFGGWRHVMYLYAVIAVLIAIPWFFSRPAPAEAGHPAGMRPVVSFRNAILNVVRIRNVWLTGVALLGIGGCIQGVLGYLPLYLRGSGWTSATADGSLAAFHTISMICVIPIALLSDRIGSRKKVLVTAGLMITLGVSLIPLVSGALVWVAVCLAGMVRDGFMAVYITSIIETEGVGAAYAGTAVGLAMVISGVGTIIAPPVGNSLAGIFAGAPFLLWAFMALAGVGFLLAARERSAKRALATN